MRGMEFWKDFLDSRLRGDDEATEMAMGKNDRWRECRRSENDKVAGESDA